MRYKVCVDDNFHFMDKGKRYTKGEYETAEEAIRVAKEIVDDYLKSNYKPEMTKEELYNSYTIFGEDPFIVSEDKSCNFSAWNYAEERCRQICDENRELEKVSVEESNKDEFDERVYNDHLKLVLQKAFDSLKAEVKGNRKLAAEGLLQSMMERGYSLENITRLQIYLDRFLEEWWATPKASELEVPQTMQTETIRQLEQLEEVTSDLIVENKRTFTFFNNAKLCAIINSSIKHIIYAAPCIPDLVAKSLCEFRENNKNAALRVIVDANAESFRLGFGDFAALKMLADKQIDVRIAEGLRIGVLVADENAWVYSPTPEIIFEQPTDKINNAVKVDVAFAKQILLSIAPDISVVTDEDILDESFLAFDVEPEIGAEKITLEVLDKIEFELEENPPQKFSQTRKVRVYNGYIQYVELKLSGFRVDSRRIEVPESLLNLNYDPDLKLKIRSTCSLFDEPLEFAGEMRCVEREINQLRSNYLRPLGERYGSVILRSKRKEFDEQLVMLQEQVDLLRESSKDLVNRRISERREKLIEMLLPGVTKNPPEFYQDDLYSNEDDLREFTAEQLDKVIPNAEDIIDRIQLTCTFKDVTFEGLEDKEFIDLVQREFPEIKLPKLHDEEVTMGQR